MNKKRKELTKKKEKERKTQDNVNNSYIKEILEYETRY